jgi:hypothetical protein
MELGSRYLGPLANTSRKEGLYYLIKELGIDNSLGNSTYTPTTLTKEEILDNHSSVLYYFGISTVDEKLDLPALY